MDAALRLFVEQGVAATPVTAIEAASGLSPGSGSFYRHFGNKQDLLTAVVEREMAKARKDPATQVSAARPGELPADVLARQIRADLDFLRDLEPLMIVLMWERGRAPEVAGRVQEVMVERGIELGVADLLTSVPAAAVADDPAAAAGVMMSAVVGYFLNVHYFGSEPAGVGADRFATTLARLLTGR